MKSESSHARVTTDDHRLCAWFDISEELSGYATRISFSSAVGAFYLCKRGDAAMLHIIMVTGPHW